jgi:hypothetical protein
MKETKNEIKRIGELIKLNAPFKSEFLDDIELIKNNPRKYWNSFLIRDGENTERTMHIKKMQQHYNNEPTLFD